uniref:TPR_REGION domain-containing protein n=1 Tax=Macrostomum lignano TaxID=282301 RepID=A0A1I8G0U0_9PLAT
WSRYVAELNPKVGALLTKAIVAYRKEQIETSALWYTLAAYCGLEVANFNLAYLCDQHSNRLNGRFAKECEFHHYNRSVWRDENQVHAKSLTRMGDYHSLGLAHASNLSAAVDFYTRAVAKGDPEAAFNLAVLAEAGRLSPSTANQLTGDAFEGDGEGDPSWLLMGPRARAAFRLYRLCEKLSKTETDLPCRLARYRLKLLTYISHYLDVLRGALLASLLALAAWRYMCSSHRD